MSAKDWKKTLIPPDTPILEAMRIIDASSMQIALVVEAAGRLQGVITDGDIRRAILQGVPLTESVDRIMNREFTTVSQDSGREEILAFMKRKGLRQIPVVDHQGRVVDLALLEDLIQLPPWDNWVVLVAGGLGTRLLPFTKECPKPLLKVGDQTVLETVLENFLQYGFHKFFISVHYKAEMIEAKFGNGSRWGVTIDYLREDRKLGTAGALGLLPGRPDLPLVVMNADLLTKVNLQHLLDFHQSHRAVATMCVRDYRLQMPYGVVYTDNHRMIGIDEKPEQRFFINAGIYVMEPEILDLIPPNTCIDMPQLFENLLSRDREVVVFPVREYWMDIGRPGDWEQANGDFSEVFR